MRAKKKKTGKMTLRIFDPRDDRGMPDDDENGTIVSKPLKKKKQRKNTERATDK